MNFQLAAFLFGCAFVGPGESGNNQDAPADGNREEFRTKIVAQVERLGGAASRHYLFAEPRYVWRLNFAHSKGKLESIKSIIEDVERKNEKVDFLSFRKTEFGDDLVKAIEVCRPTYEAPDGGPAPFSMGLNALDISHSGLTKNGLTQILAVHRNLNWVDLSALPVDSRSLSGIGKLWLLQTLLLRNTPLDDAAAKAIATASLKKLDVANSSIGNGFIKSLAATPRMNSDPPPKLVATLEELDLSGTRITDEALEYLRSFAKLRKLDLSNTLISDEKQLRFLLDGLPQLREIAVSGTGLPEAALSRLSKDWPKIWFSK